MDRLPNFLFTKKIDGSARAVLVRVGQLMQVVIVNFGVVDHRYGVTVLRVKHDGDQGIMARNEVKDGLFCRGGLSGSAHVADSMLTGKATLYQKLINLCKVRRGVRAE